MNMVMKQKNQRESCKMNDFVFQNTTKVYFGKDQLKSLGEELKQYGQRVLLVYGGGSTIDCTKAIAAAAYYDGDAWDLVKGTASVGNALPIVTVLTFAATGSEMDCGGVISNMQTHEKLAILNPLLQPKTSFLNPENTYSVSQFQTACGSVDILSHVFDSFYFTMQPKMDFIDRVMTDLIKTVVKYAPIALETPDNYEARANLMWASSWALNGFVAAGIDQDVSCHIRVRHRSFAFGYGRCKRRDRRAFRLLLPYARSAKHAHRTRH